MRREDPRLGVLQRDNAALRDRCRDLEARYASACSVVGEVRRVASEMSALAERTLWETFEHDELAHALRGFAADLERAVAGRGGAGAGR